MRGYNINIRNPPQTCSDIVAIETHSSIEIRVQSSESRRFSGSQWISLGSTKYCVFL